MRYICNFSTAEIDKESYDVVIVGSGIAGLYTALNLDRNIKIAILSKDTLLENNTSLAQGGVAAAIKPDDNPRLHFADTLKAGDLNNDKKAVEILVNEAEKNILNTVRMGIKYDRDKEGDILSTMEGGHSRRRVIHAGGDATGRELHRGLLSIALSRENIEVFEKAFGVDLLVKGNRCCGILVEADEKKKIFYSKALILATGGIGQIYENTTNSKIATGDGIAMAYRAGARLKDMEFIQFHPTVLYSKEFEERYGRSFLISEAVRGEGAVLRNKAGRRFMKEVSGQELAPRDVVARAMYKEMLKEGSEYLYLDITHKGKEFLVNRFPTIYSTCKEIGIDMTCDYIPVVPAAHYLMGGIEVDLMGKTSISFLYACGECSCTGVHGANRLASNSLLEGLVFGRRIARDINKVIGKTDIQIIVEQFDKCNDLSAVDWGNIRIGVEKVMKESAGIIRSREGLRKALEELDNTLFEIEKMDCTDYYQMETKNMILVAHNVINAALMREKSCGAHYIVNQEGES